IRQPAFSACSPPPVMLQRGVYRFGNPAYDFRSKEEIPMSLLTRTLCLSAAAAAVGVAFCAAPVLAQQVPGVSIGKTDIGGVVRSRSGPEAGVWVIAETTELPTKFAKIVVTDDQGRYVIPDLPPNVNYQVWVRGYGLVDSPKRRAKPGQMVALTAVPAPDARSAAQYYPA